MFLKKLKHKMSEQELVSIEMFGQTPTYMYVYGDHVPLRKLLLLTIINKKQVKSSCRAQTDMYI